MQDHCLCLHDITALTLTLSSPVPLLPPEAEPAVFPTTPLDLTVLRDAFTVAVEKRMMSDVPFGASMG